ncbi:MAG: hypothetical protein CMG75_03200 [Candidatus Marinimicrobia bacterium]|nr:hypothetical protein [Candidatus Neomarinimicrobiota bacterium]|tara:strand:+ start:31123 stop:32247 length:1125 start_codon:yes stop_codon:yes gene_type:complete
MFDIVLLCLISFYSFIILSFTCGLFINKEKRVNIQPFVSIIIAALNEQDHIEKILYDVTHQTYPSEKYEILVIDDESSDNTSNLVIELSKKYQNVKLLNAKYGDPSLNYKKRPLDLGIRNASGEIILQTDADCRVKKYWIETMVSYFSDNVGMVIGHSQINKNQSLSQQIEALDFLMLSATGRSTAQFGIPFAATGQNLSFRKKTFFQVNGFSEFADALGGDDTFLLQSIRNKTDWDIVVALDKNSFAQTVPSLTGQSFISQRRRWASDSLYFKNTNPLFFIVITTTFLANMIIIISLGKVFIFSEPFQFLINILIIKFIIEGLLMIKATSVFNCATLRKAFLPWFFLQIPYIVYMGIVTLMPKNSRWGGRHTI